jgi:hypothetical protein
MRNLPAPALSTTPRQLSIPFDSPWLRRTSPAERRRILARLARLLLEAAGVAVGEHDDGGR